MKKAVSLFSGGGVGETYLNDLDIKVTVSNEINHKRAQFYQHLYPETKMIIGDINDKRIKSEILNSLTGDEEILIATPPCQGVSTLGKNKKVESFNFDKRNFLIYDVIEIIDSFDFKYILIENVSRFLKMKFPVQDGFDSVENIFRNKFGRKYNIQVDILNTKDYEVPQSRPRFILRMFKKNTIWELPKTSPEITLRECIGHLPSLESNQSSKIQWHYAKKHNDREILAMKNTPTGKSAFKNKVYYPKNKNGDLIKGFHNTYKRLEWDRVCHARTTNCGTIGSHNNVHPGRRMEDGTYSDARVLTIHELLIVSSLPLDWNIPEFASDNLVRQIIGESVPPRFIKKLFESIN